MPSHLSADIEEAARGNPALRRLLQAHADVIRSIGIVIGHPVEIGQQKREDQQLKVPPQGSISVLGLNGHFYVTLTPANPLVDRRAGELPGSRVLPGDPWGALDGRRSRAIDIVRQRDGRRLGAIAGIQTHEIQSATSLLFDASSSVTTFGPSTDVFRDVLDPNQQKYWRFRSRFTNSDYNAWTYFINPAFCGPIAVDSGMLSSGAAVVLNVGNTPNPQPLTQSGTSTRINVASTTNPFGSAANVTYNSGFVDPGAYGTFYVYCLDHFRRGGTVTYIASTSNPTITSNDDLVYFGKITTNNGGGGAGSGGGTGPCCIGEVEVDLADGSKLAHSRLRVGMSVLNIYGEHETIERIEMTPRVPCFQFRGENGLVLRGCSTQHSLQYDGGGFDHAFLIVTGHRLDTKLGATKIERSFIGHHTVYKLHLSGRSKTYWADGFASHNVLK